MKLLVSILALLIVSINPGNAQPADLSEQVGNIYEIKYSYETSRKTGDQSSGRSSGTNLLIERIIAINEESIDLEYDISLNPSEEDRAREWKLPAKVRRNNDGTLLLLNTDEMEIRITKWLEKASWTREVCDQWIFTWNAFKIECDPQSALELITSYDLNSNNFDPTKPYENKFASHAGKLQLLANTPEGKTYHTKLELNPQIIKTELAETQLIIGQITGKEITIEDAQKEQALKSISGNIQIKLDVDNEGRLIKRTEVFNIKTIEDDGTIKTETKTNILSRSLISADKNPQ